MPNPFIEYWHGFIVIFFFTFSPTVEPDPRQEFKSIHNIIFNLSSKQYNIDNGIPSPNTKEKRPLLSEKSNDREL